MSYLASLTSSTTKSQKRIGRGYGSGKGGHTSTRGQKGQKSRSGSKIPLWFEGGQLPLIKRLPMWRGKNRLNSLSRIAIVSLSQINSIDTTEITPETLRLYKLVPARTAVCKVVATGAVTKEVHLRGIQVSATARQAIESAGGSVTEV